MRKNLGKGALAVLFAVIAIYSVQQVAAYEKMLKKPKAEFCFLCHGDKQAVYNKSGHGKVSVTCDMCHDPHGVGQEKMLKKAPKDICFMCHSDKKSHYMSTGHGKVDVTCMMCHNPHGTPSAAKPAPKKK